MKDGVLACGEKQPFGRTEPALFVPVRRGRESGRLVEPLSHDDHTNG